jgi:hypothetical protein
MENGWFSVCRHHHCDHRRKKSWLISRITQSIHRAQTIGIFRDARPRGEKATHRIVRSNWPAAQPQPVHRVTLVGIGTGQFSPLTPRISDEGLNQSDCTFEITAPEQLDEANPIPAATVIADEATLSVAIRVSKPVLAPAHWARLVLAVQHARVDTK